MDERKGYIVIGKLPNAKCIPVNYVPSEQELRNMRLLFGMDYMTVAEMEAYEAALDEEEKKQ